MNVSDEYLAGLFDGEGCVTIMRLVGKRRWRPLHALACMISMSHQGAVSLFAARFGGGRIQYSKPRNENRLPMWTWRVQGEHAADFLDVVAPFLVVKREQASIGLDFQRSKVRSKHLPDEEIAKRESFRQRIIRLNGYRGMFRKPFPTEAQPPVRMPRPRPPERTHCKYGHPWVNDNIYTSPDGCRYCRQCMQVRRLKWIEQNPGYVPQRRRPAIRSAS